MKKYLIDKSNSFDDLLRNYTPGDTLYPVVFIKSSEYQDEFFTSFFLNSREAFTNGVRFENDRLIICDTPEDYYTNRRLLLEDVGIDCCTYYVQGSPEDKCMFFSKWALESFEEGFFNVRKASVKERNNLVGVVSLYHKGYREALTIMLLRSPIPCSFPADFSDIKWNVKYNSLKYVGKRVIRMFILNHLCNKFLSNGIDKPLYSPDINPNDENNALLELDKMYDSLPEDIKNLYMLLPVPVQRSYIKNTEGSKSFRINLVSRYMHCFFNFLISQKEVGKAKLYLDEHFTSNTVEFVEKSYNRIMSTPEFSLTRKTPDLIYLCIDLYFLNRLYESNLKSRRVISRWLYILLYRARNEVSLEERTFIDAMMVNTLTFNAEQFDSMLEPIKETKIKTSYFTTSWVSDKPRFATSEITYLFNGGEQPIINQLSGAERELLSDTDMFRYDTIFELMLYNMQHSVSHYVMDIQLLRESYAELLYNRLVQDSSTQPYFGFVAYEQTW